MKILCIDDDPVFRKIVEGTLGPSLLPEDHLWFAQTGIQGCDMLERDTPDLVFADLVLPDLSGIEILKHVRKMTTPVEVIVITGEASIDTAVEAIRNGARDYITKPVNATVLIEKVNTLREFLLRSREAEDYRFAKEVIEPEASTTVRILEQKLDRCMCALEALQRAAQSSEPTEQRLESIRRILATYGVEPA